MFKGLKARLNDSIATSDASFSISDTSTPNTSFNNAPTEGGSLFGKFRQRISEVVNNTSTPVQDVETPEAVMQITEEEMMDIDKLIILTPGNQLPDLFRKQAISRLKIRKKLKYVIGQYNGVVAEHNSLQEETKQVREDLLKARKVAALSGEYKKQIHERTELIHQLQSQIEILKETALVPEPAAAGSGAALIDISELSESIVSDTGEVDNNMPYEQLYDRYQRYKLRYDKNRDRLEKLSGTCQKLQKQNENLQRCLTVSQDRAIKKITQLKDSTNSIVDERREMESMLQEKDERIVTLRDQLQNISAMSGFSDTESIMSEASEYNSDVVSESLTRRNTRLKDKVKRLEDVLGKCKTTIQNGIEATNSLTKEKEELKDRLEKLEFELAERGTAGEVTSSNEVLVDLGEHSGSTPTNTTDARMNDLMAERDHLKKEEEERSQEIFQLVTEVERYKQEILRLQTEVTMGHDNVTELKSEVTSSKGQVMELSNNIKQMTADFNVKENGFLSEIEEYKQEAAKLQDRLNKISAESEELKRNLHDRDVNKAMELQDTKKEYAGQVTLLNNKISALKQELETANRSLSVLKDRDSSLEDLLEEMSGIRGELERVSTENTELREQLAGREVEMNESSKEKEREMEQLQNKQREEMSAKRNELESQLGKVREKYENEKSEKEVLLVKEQELKQQISGLEEDCKRLSNELELLNQEHKKEKTDLENKMSQLQDSKIRERETLEETHRSQLTPFKTKIKEMQAQISKLQDTKEEQDQEISDLTRHVFESNSDCAQLNDEVLNLQNKLQSSDKSVVLLQDQLKSKTTECVDLADNLSTTNDNLKASQMTANELQKQLEKLTKEKTGLDEQLEKLDTMNKDLDKLVTDLRRKAKNSDEEHEMKCAQLKEAINSVMTDRDNLTRQHAALKEQFTSLEENLASKAGGTEILSEQNRLLQDRVNGLQEEVNSLSQNLSSAESANKQLANEEAKVREALKDVEQENKSATEKLEANITAVKKELELSQDQKNELEEKIKNARNELDTMNEACEKIKKKSEKEKEILKNLLTQVREELKTSEEMLEKKKKEEEEKGVEIKKLSKKLKEMEDGKKESGDLLTKIRELESDLEIKNKSISKLEADSINNTANFNSKISSLQDDLESSHTTCQLLRKQCEKAEAQVGETQRVKEEEVKTLELRREEDVKMFAAQHEEEVKKQEELEAAGAKLKEEINELEAKLQTEIASHQKAKEGLGKASQAIAKLRGYVKEQENKIENLTKINTDLENKSRETVDAHNTSLSEVQQSYMTKLEQSAETENRLKLELKSLSGQLTEVRDERGELEGRVVKLKEELSGLKEILKGKMEENSRLNKEVELSKKESLGNQSASEERLSNLNNQVKQLQNQLEHLRTSEIQIRKMLEEHSGNKIEVNNDNRNTESDLSTAIQEAVLNLSSRLSKEQQDHAIAAEQRNQFKVKLVELKKKAEAKFADMNEGKKVLEEELTQLRANTTQSNEQTNKLQTEIKQLQDECKLAKEQNVELQEQLLRLQEQAGLEKQQSSSFEEQIVQLGGDNDELREEITKLQEEKAKMAASISDVNNQLANSKQQCEQLSFDQRSIQEQFEVSEKANTELKGRIAELEEKHRLTLENSLSNVESDKLAARLSQLEESCEDKDKQIQELTSQLEKLRDSQTLSNEQKLRIEELENALKRDSSELELLRKERETLQTERENLLMEGESGKSLTAELQDKLQSAEQELSKLSQQILDLQQQTTTLQNNGNDAQSEIASLQQRNSDLQTEITSLQEELTTARSYLEKQEEIQSTSQVTEEKLREEVKALVRELKQKSDGVAHLEKQVASLKSDLSDYSVSKEAQMKLCGDLKSKVRDLETSLSAREDDMKTLQQDNSRLSSHAKSLDVCFSSLKEEKNKIVDSLSQMVSEKESLERAHKAELLETKTRLEKEHALNMQQITQSMQDKIQKAMQDEGVVAKLQTQVTKLETAMGIAREEAERAQAKCSVQVSEYSSKLLQAEKKSKSLRDQLSQLSETLQTRDQEVASLKSDNISQLNVLKKETMSKSEHEEIVFNLEMAYNMNLQETTDKLEGRIRELENHLGADFLPERGAGVTSSQEIADLKKHLDNITRRHKIEIETIKNEAIFNANKEYETKLKHWQESNEQRHLEDVNRVMEENSRDRQRLLREMETLRQSRDHVDKLNQSAGRISVSSEYSDHYLLEAEYEYLKDVLFKYLKGEHTDQLLKVILAVLKYSEKERTEILGGIGRGG